MTQLLSTMFKLNTTARKAWPKIVLLLSLVSTQMAWAQPCASPAPMVTNGSRCGTGTVVLSANNTSAGVFRWYTALTGGTALRTSASAASDSYTTPSLSATTTYYVTFQNGTCESAPRTAIVATVNTIPGAPSVTPGGRCGTGTVTLSAGSATAGTFTWYSALTAGTVLQTSAAGLTANSYTTVSLSANTTYYVTVKNASGCESTPRTAITATINAAPASPTVTAGSTCGPGTVILSANSATAGTFKWYDLASGGTLLQTSAAGLTTNNFTTPSLNATKIYYVTMTNSINCESTTRTAVTATVNSASIAPTITGGSRCGTGTVVLSANNTSAGVFRWYTALTGGTALQTSASAASNSYTTPSLSATTTYYVTFQNGTCESAPRTAIVATVNTIPGAPTVTPGGRCGPGTVTLSAGSATAGTFTWYSALTAGTVLQTSAAGLTANSYTTVSLSANTTYYVTVKNASGCESTPRTAITATVNAAPAAPTVTAGSTCGPGTVILSANSTTAGTFKWYDLASGGTLLQTSAAGLTTNNFTTPSLNATKIYYVTLTNSVNCESTTRTAVTATVNSASIAPTITGGSRCGTGTVVLSANNTSAGVFRWYTALTGGTALQTSASAASDSYTTPSLSATTTYYVTFQNGTCESAPRTAIVATVNTTPGAPTVTPGGRCGPGTVTLSAGSATAGTFTWYSALTAGTVLQTSAAGLTANSYTTVSLSANTTYYVTVKNASGCESTPRTAITATVNAAPAAPTVTAGSTCGPGTVTLSANSATAGTFKWYDLASGGTLLQTSAAGLTTNNFTTPSLSITTTYYVTLTNSVNCESATRTAVTATVNANSPATQPTTTNGTRCGTGTLVLSASSTTSGTFRWYNALTGGALVQTSTAATSNNYTTPSLSTTTTYFVTFNNGTCESTPRKAVTATVNTVAVTPTATGGLRCGTGTVALSATSTTAGTFKWYAALTGGTALRTSPTAQTTDSYTTPSISATTTYYVTFTNASGCESTPRTAVAATVTPSPTVFTLSGGGNVGLGSLTVSLSGSQTGTSYQLLLNGASSGAPQVGAGASLSWTVSQEGTYTVNAQIGSCSVPMGGSAIFTSGLVPDQVEFNALKDLFTSTNGANWTNKTNWPTNWPTTSTAAQMGTWFGITAANGDVSEISILANNLVGTMPESMGNLKQMWFLALHTNPGLVGPIPLSIGSLPNLGELRLFSCALTGTIPSALFDLPKIYIIDLSGNKLTGGIPNNIGNATKLIDINLGGNNLTGVIPSSIVNLANLRSLLLYANQLEGVVPNDIGNLTQLTNLSLGSNKLTGTVPSSIANMTKLETFGVNNNQFNGALPSNFFSGWNNLKLVFLSSNNFTSIPNLSTHPNKANLWVNVDNNLLDFSSIEPMVNQGLQAYTYAPQKNISDVSTITFGLTNLNIPARPTTANSSSIIWEKQQLDGSWLNVDSSNQDASQKTFKINTPLESDAGNYRWRMTSTLATGMTLQSDPIALVFSPSIDELIAADAARVNVIPAQVKMDRNGQIPIKTLAPSYLINTLNKGDLRPVFPECENGKFYVGFQLYYGLEDKKTVEEWLSQLTVTLLHKDENSLEEDGFATIWSGQLQVNTKNQTFVSTAFYNQAILCDGTYQLRLDQKLKVGVAPEANIALKVLLYPADEGVLSTATSVTNFSCTKDVANKIQLIGDPVSVADEYDFEWVFIAEHENINPSSPQEAFTKREPVRVTIPAISSLSHQIFYQTGKMWCRIRPVGYNPQYPDHRITGTWSYRSSALEVTNPQADKNWQVQTVFAEEGKNKKVVHYFDGTLRTRQSQTNLSTENITLSGETLYDFEGRKSVEILAAPSQTEYNNSLTFKAGLNNFQASDLLVTANISSTRKKFHYDNGQLAENSTLSTSDGAGNYYSTANIRPSTHRMLIPNGEGYVYSQTEYLNDGTGRVKKQSGVGKEFKIDGNTNRATKYYYGEAAEVELRRLFGSNVGNATHYKKNLVVDANGQVSVSYHDQSDRVIASALAGNKPDNVDPLPSFTILNGAQITEDISGKNQRVGSTSVTSHKLLNTFPNNGYSFSYELNALNAQINQWCPTCKFELTITITDPDGALIDLGVIADNDASDRFSYLKKNITSANCPGSFNQVVQIGPLPLGLTLAKIGDYTITKTLKVVELTFDEMKTLVQQSPSVQAKIQQLRDSYVPDASQCDICTTGDCADTDKNILDAINKVASLDCENIKNRIIEKLIKDHSDDLNYYPPDSDIEKDADFCLYRLCMQDKASDVFEKQLALVSNWTTAEQKGYGTAVDIDPFFKEKGLSGYGYKSTMVDRLNNISIGDINANLKIPRPILMVLDPNNSLYYIDEQGNATNSVLSGYHILYYELMKEKPLDYSTQLDKQRWALYKSFYLEAKRKTKLSMPAYSTDCASAKAVLEQTDKMPKSEDEANKWADRIDVNAISEEQINSVFSLLTFNCNASAPLNISNQDAANIKDQLRWYFTYSSNNFYKYIFKRDLAVDGTNQLTNPYLRAIKTILAGYDGGCASTLDRSAVDDPLFFETTKTLVFPLAQLPNLVVNPGVNPTPDCTTFITNNGCYNGWSPKSGAPEVPYSGQNIIRLSAQRCNVTSSAVGGSIVKELVPGKKYRFSVTYRSPFTNQIDNLYCQLFSQEGYTRTDGSKFVSGNPSTPCSPFTTSTSQATGGENMAIVPPTCSSCMEPGATYPDDITVNGQDTKKLWMKQNVVNTNGWTTDEVIFTATQKSTNFVFSTIPNDGGIADVQSNNLTTWGTNGTFDSNDESIPQMFNGINTTGTVQSGYLSIKNVAGPESKGGALLKFNAIANSSSSVFSITAKVWQLPNSSISTNQNAVLYISTPNPDWEILDNNYVPFSSLNSIRTLRLRIARKPGVGLVPLPDYFTISTNMKDIEAKFSSGELRVDDIFVFDNAYEGVGFSGPIKSVEIKDVTIKEYFEPSRTFCIGYGTTIVPDYIAQYKATCMENEAKRKGLLAQIAVDNLLEAEINSFRTQCLANASETLKYSYTPREHHYTLYYYDQAGNLVQTVPPEGVVPVPMNRLGIDNPTHKLVTRYAYNSLNQLLDQTTPDAGESNFWYNDKSQLRLSQNAQQRIDNKYSYTKYDEQGRIIEVGEMYSTEPALTFVSKVEDSTFPVASTTPVPSPGTYLLTDITRTYYDFANPNYASGPTFTQQNLRNRVAWVEVLDKGKTDATTTYYSYDIHGNVKSLVQQIPSLPTKRTDYLYDLVSGKVNFVMYQFGEQDQFIHRYTYDPDNRIVDVKTSADRFWWDTDARYKYYLHGPLARVELGQHFVQGLDYYYTLQGWLKGVNSPTGAGAQANDPGRDGHGTSTVGKDAYAYNLGYYNGDYKPIGGAVAQAALLETISPPGIWNEVGQQTDETFGLYNGNIAWMATDLSSIASAKEDRNKGLQAMQYRYDQLHRIVRSRSLTFNGSAIARTTAAYDENYTYDANGNILTLLRNNKQGTSMDNFAYQYYAGTNRLREVKPITDNATYRSAITSNTKLYRNITVTDDAYVPDGADVTLRATENIYLHPRFKKAGGKSFRAYITDEGNYQYDAIGNLIVDKAEGTKISWTPYGKVREVKTKGDSVTVSYRYDASGNRVEKRVTTLTDAGNTTVKATSYLRDASGNVMAIYTDNVMIEQPIYGSARLGQYRGGHKEGQHTLGKKHYELSNHLGNVLTVITDNVNMSTTDGVYATVVSATDYYPFGLEMDGRTFNDEKYRYGFNGKEKDNSFAGDNSYDYGFRIYNPRIAKFLSVDPLAADYPWLTPYLFAGNMPIIAIDVDGAGPGPRTSGKPNTKSPLRNSRRGQIDYNRPLRPPLTPDRMTMRDFEESIFGSPNNPNVIIINVEEMYREYLEGYDKLYGVSNSSKRTIGDDYQRYRELSSMPESKLTHGEKNELISLRLLKASYDFQTKQASSIPLGFNSFGQLQQFGTQLQAGLSKAGFKDAKLYMQGSSAKGFSHDGIAFGDHSDFDVALTGESLFEAAEKLKLTNHISSGPIGAGSDAAKSLGINELLINLSKKFGRDVNVMIFKNVNEVKIKEPASIRIPTSNGG